MVQEVRARHIARRDRVTEPDQEDSGRRTGDETWSLLLRASARTFAHSGYSGASLQEIADAVGMLKGSLYYYIHSKEDLLYEIVRDVLQRALQVIGPLADGPGDGLERLARIAEAHVRHLIANLAETKVFINDVVRLSPERRAQLPEKEFVGIYERVIDEGRADGSISADMSTLVIRRLVLGLANSVAAWYGSLQDAPVDDIAQDIARVIHGGFAPRAS